MEEAQMKYTGTKARVLSPLASSIIKVVLYYDIFKYPVTQEEIFTNIPYDIKNEIEVKAEIEHLLFRFLIKKKGKYFFVTDDDSVVERRIKGNQQAEKYLIKAKRMSKIIAAFPFIRGISLSGSISKGYMDEQADIDYFIITKPDRLWLSRMLLVLFKKIFLLNSRKYFCINYFIDDQNLKISEENIYTATEVVTLIPTYNYNLYKKFIAHNYWTKRFKPNFPVYQNGHMQDEKYPFIKRILENVLGGRTGNYLDNLCFKITIKFWKKKFSDFSKDEFDHSFKSNKKISTHHPQNFQKKVLTLYEKKIKDFEKENNVTFS